MNHKEILILIKVSLKVTLLTSFLWGGSLFADEKAAKVGKLMELAGANWIIKAFVEEMELEQAKERITTAAGGLNEVEKALYFNQFDLNSMKKDVRDALLEELSIQNIEALIVYFNHPIVMKMINADIANDKIDESQSAKMYLRSILRSPPSIERIKLIHDLVDTSLVVEQEVYLSAVITYEKNKTPLAFYEKYGEEEAQKLEYYIENYKQKMVDAIRPEMRLAFMRIYSEFSDKEIRELFDLMQNDLRLHYQTVFVDALAQVIAQSIKSGIDAILKHRQKQPL